MNTHMSPLSRTWFWFSGYTFVFTEIFAVWMLKMLNPQRQIRALLMNLYGTRGAVSFVLIAEDENKRTSFKVNLN